MDKPIKKSDIDDDKIRWPYYTEWYNDNIKCCRVLIRGYKVFCDYKHPLAYKATNHVYYHRHVASLKLGRWVGPDDIVHHVNGDKLDNSPDNLLVINRKEHIKEHKDGGKIKKNA
jgi:hypothetical protein